MLFQTYHSAKTGPSTVLPFLSGFANVLVDGSGKFLVKVWSGRVAAKEFLLSNNSYVA